jgi:hypothetical protein
MGACRKTANDVIREQARRTPVQNATGYRYEFLFENMERFLLTESR